MSGSSHTVRQGLTALLTLLVGVVIQVSAPAAAEATSPLGAARVTSTVSSDPTPRMLRPFAREVVRPGDDDIDPYHIEHVYELQWRLVRVGLYDGYPTGHYGSMTLHAVKQFKRRVGLAATGVMGARAWEKLIKHSIRGRADIPDVCWQKGWRVCYDRQRHQVTLFHKGEILNSWLVRGGDWDKQTLTGDYMVYERDIDHVSSQFDDAPMPYSQFFHGGQALHGSRYMVDPYEGHSHGCVNFYVKDARQLWKLTYDKQLHVHVYGDWD